MPSQDTNPSVTVTWEDEKHAEWIAASTKVNPSANDSSPDGSSDDRVIDVQVKWSKDPLVEAERRWKKDHEPTSGFDLSTMKSVIYHDAVSDPQVHRGSYTRLVTKLGIKRHFINDPTMSSFPKDSESDNLGVFQYYDGKASPTSERDEASGFMQASDGKRPYAMFEQDLSDNDDTSEPPARRRNRQVGPNDDRS